MTVELALLIAGLTGAVGLMLGLCAGFGACFYRDHISRQESQRAEQRHLAEKDELKTLYADAAIGQLTYRTFFKRSGFFGLSLKTLFVAYDRRQKAVLHLSGYVSEYRLFPDIPPELVNAIGKFIAASATPLPIAA